MKTDPLVSCKPSRFISHMQELSDYFVVRKKVPVITNVPRLINVTKVYFDALLYYSANSRSKGVVQIGGKKYLTSLDGYSEKGEKVKLDLTDISENIVKNIIEDLVKVTDLTQFGVFIHILNSAIVTPKLADRHKISILNAENTLPKGSWYNLVRQLPEELALMTAELRLNLVKKILSDISKHISTDEYYDANAQSVQKAYELYLKTLLRIHVTNNHYVDIFSTIENELADIGKLKVSEGISKEKLLTFLLTQLVLNNNLFQFESRSSIREYISDHESQIDVDTAAIIYDGIDFNPDNFELSDCSIELAEPDVSKLNEDNVKTMLSFVIPFEMEDDSCVRELGDGTRIEFKKIYNLYDDPIYMFVDSAEMSINGMPLTFFSDSLGNIGGTIRVNILLNSFYHPDFKLNDVDIIKIEDDKKKAKRGGRFSPHKDLIIDCFWELNEKEALPFKLEIKELNSNIISNYLVSYTSEQGELIHHKVYTITNFNTYFNAKNRFIEKLNSHYYYDSSCEIKEFLLHTNITSRKSFLDFCYTLLDLTLKKAVEFGGLHISFWNNLTKPRTPIPEPQAQPIIYNQVRFLAQMKGVRVSREVIAADGSLDFHFSYTKNDILMNVCVELKNAHHSRLVHGMTTQLPLYINDIGNRMGIFLILWFKGAEFDEPKKFDTIESMEKFLVTNAPKKYQIKPLIIDCTKKESPSVARSRQRL